MQGTYFSLHFLVAFTSSGCYPLLEFISLLGFLDQLFLIIILSFPSFFPWQFPLPPSTLSETEFKVCIWPYTCLLGSFNHPMTPVTVIVSNLTSLLSSDPSIQLLTGHFQQCLTDITKVSKANSLPFLSVVILLLHTILMKSIHPVSQQGSLKILGVFLLPPLTCTKHPRSDQFL